MAAHDYCQSDELLEAVSPITGNRVRVNLSYGKVYVPHDMDVGLARKLGAELPGLWERQASAAGNGWKSSHDMRLWAHGLVAIPPKWTSEYKINCPVSDFTVVHHRAWLEDIAAAVSMKSERERRRAQGLALRIATTAVGVRELARQPKESTIYLGARFLRSGDGAQHLIHRGHEVV